MHRTLDDIRREGLAALRQRLGRAGLVRFLQQFTHGEGDYAQERHVWVDATSLDDLRARTKRAVRSPRRRKKRI